MRPDDLIQLTEDGLYCPAGDFHIDPWAPVERAVTTHAHADHAKPGSRAYLATPETAVLLHKRLSQSTIVEPLPYEHRKRIGEVIVSLHPAGHVLGSAQVRVEPVAPGPTWVITGDYGLTPNPTCAPFEPIPCDVILTESTFGLPVFRWQEPDVILRKLNEFWRDSQRDNRTTVFLGWSLGKAQRILAGLDASIGPIGTHPAVEDMCACYKRCGVSLPNTIVCDERDGEGVRGTGAVVAPPAVYGSRWLRNQAGPGGLRVANVSGWMALRGPRRWRPVDRGFPLSDHADWPGLLHAIRLSGASRVGVTHGFSRTLSRWLNEQALDAFVVPTRFVGEQPADEVGPSASEGANLHDQPAPTPPLSPTPSDKGVEQSETHELPPLRPGKHR